MVVMGAGILGVGLAACEKSDSEPVPGAAAPAAPAGLTPEQAAQVLAKVGERTITLGEYAATLERMDRFERFRYQTPERRKALLDEMITLELLAIEARKRGLDQTPEVRERLRILLRDQVVRDLRAEMPDPGALPREQVRRYYDEHLGEFREPERRRIAVIVTTSRAEAEAALQAARGATGAGVDAMQWGRLVQKYSLVKPPAPSPTAPLELAGDLGVYAKPAAVGSSSSGSAAAPGPVIDAAFRLKGLGAVSPELVEAGGKFYVVRLVGETPARERSFEEAERGIRVVLVQQTLAERERALEATLRQKFPVVIDEAALAGVEVPALPPEPARGAPPAGP